MKRIFLLLLIALLCCCCLCGCQTKAEDLIYGVWWWKDSLDDSYLDFAKQNNITEIYYCTGKFNDETESFIQKANAKGIKVFWLTGRYQWVEDSTQLITQMAKYQNFQSAHTHRFEGVHFDIEPQQHPDWKTRRAELLTLFVDLVYQLRTEYPDIWIEYDIPFWMHDAVTSNGVTKETYKHVIDNANRITMMSYRDTAEKIYDVSKEEIAYALEVGKTLNLGVNTKSTEGDNVSFQEEGKKEMYNQIAQLRTMIPSDFGVVIHHMEAWRNLKD